MYHRMRNLFDWYSSFDVSALLYFQNFEKEIS